MAVASPPRSLGRPGCLEARMFYKEQHVSGVSARGLIRWITPREGSGTVESSVEAMGGRSATVTRNTRTTTTGSSSQH